MLDIRKLNEIQTILRLYLLFVYIFSFIYYTFGFHSSSLPFLDSHLPLPLMVNDGSSREDKEGQQHKQPQSRIEFAREKLVKSIIPFFFLPCFFLLVFLHAFLEIN